MSEAKTLASRPPFAAFVGDEETRVAVIDAAAKAGVDTAEIYIARFADVVVRFQHTAPPSLLLVDVSDVYDPMAEMTRLAEVCVAGTQVIALGTVNDIRLCRDLQAFGVHDYLVKPVQVDELARSLTAVMQPAECDTKPAEPGRLITVIGARGGVGATTLTVNLAWALSRAPDRKVAIVDFDLFFGSCSLALDVDASRGFREAIENPARVDALFIERAMVRADENLFVLSMDEMLGHRLTVDGARAETLVGQFRRDFSHVVVDLPRFALRTQAGMMSAPASAVLVSDPTRAGVRDTARLLRFLRANAADTEVSVVLNRCGARPCDELAVQDFEAQVNASVSTIIPFDAPLFGSGSSSGKPLGMLKPRAKAVAAMRELSARVAGAAPVATARPAGWKRLLTRTA